MHHLCEKFFEGNGRLPCGYLLIPEGNHDEIVNSLYCPKFLVVNGVLVNHLALMAIIRNLLTPGEAQGDSSDYIVPLQILSGVIILFTIPLLNSSSTFSRAEKLVEERLDVSVGFLEGGLDDGSKLNQNPDVGSLLNVADTITATVPNFSVNPVFLTYIVILLPLALQFIPELLSHMIKKDDSIFPQYAFCSMNASIAFTMKGNTTIPTSEVRFECSKDQQENLLRWWTQILIAIFLVTFNRVNSSQISQFLKKTRFCPSGQFKEFHGDIYSKPQILLSIYIMLTGVLAFYYNGMIFDAEFARGDYDNERSQTLFNDVGLFRVSLSLIYLLFFIPLNVNKISPRKSSWQVLEPTPSFPEEKRLIFKRIGVVPKRSRWILFPSIQSRCFHWFLNEDTKLVIPVAFLLYCLNLIMDNLLFKGRDGEKPLVEAKNINLTAFSFLLTYQFIFSVLYIYLKKKQKSLVV
ncbi:hypothetical protein DID73_01085 [Candidatus Marinamargulisbacteria bacterium SCGC AG-343-K17]|nr:hypothetical protein DID73_01085 [Candidatus Marinamargulisbacteria bacterium SCGC AG-343-K17]